jgi:hypothetical protein
MAVVDCEGRGRESDSISMKSVPAETTCKLGDPVMAERWIAVFRETTDLRVVNLSDAIRYGVSDHGQIILAKRMSAEAQADCVLFGNVVGQEPKKSFSGWKECSSRRLFLYLLSAKVPSCGRLDCSSRW